MASRLIIKDIGSKTLDDLVFKIYFYLSLVFWRDLHKTPQSTVPQLVSWPRTRPSISVVFDDAFLLTWHPLFNNECRLTETRRGTSRSKWSRTDPKSRPYSHAQRRQCAQYWSLSTNGLKFETTVQHSSTPDITHKGEGRLECLADRSASEEWPASRTR